MLRTAILSSFLVFALAATAFGDERVSLTGANPSQILVESAPKVEVLTLYGTGFIIGGHPDYYQYDHLQYRRVEPNGTAGEWQICARPKCSYSSGLSTQWTFDLIDHDMFTKPGWIEWRFWTGLAMPDAADPSDAMQSVHSDWSNVFPIPIIASLPTPTPKPTPAPTPTPLPRYANMNLAPAVSTLNSGMGSVITRQRFFIKGHSYRVTAQCEMFANANGAFLYRNGKQFYATAGTIGTVNGDLVSFGQTQLVPFSILQQYSGGIDTINGLIRTDCLVPAN